MRLRLREEGFIFLDSLDDVVTAWVALSDSNEANGCLRVQAGSHEVELPHDNLYNKDNSLTRGQTICEQDLDPSKQIAIELTAGQASLHHFRLAHGSGQNRSDDRRIGFAIRYVAGNAEKVGNAESALLVRGKNLSNFVMEERITDLSEYDRKLQHIHAVRRKLLNVFESETSAGFRDRILLKIIQTLGLLRSWRFEFIHRCKNLISA